MIKLGRLFEKVIISCDQLEAMDCTIMTRHCAVLGLIYHLLYHSKVVVGGLTSRCWRFLQECCIIRIIVIRQRGK